MLTYMQTFLLTHHVDCIPRKVEAQSLALWGYHFAMGDFVEKGKRSDDSDAMEQLLYRQ